MVTILKYVSVWNKGLTPFVGQLFRESNSSKPPTLTKPTFAISDIFLIVYFPKTFSINISSLTLFSALIFFLYYFVLFPLKELSQTSTRVIRQCNISRTSKRYLNAQTLTEHRQSYLNFCQLYYIFYTKLYFK